MSAMVRVLIGVSMGLVVAGCTSVIDGRRGLPPFFEYLPRAESLADADPAPDTSPSDAGGHPDSASADWDLRPLLGHLADGDRNEWASLWPIYFQQDRPPTHRRWLIPLWYHGTFEHDADETDTDGFLLPFFFYGNDSLEGAYFLLFPVAGVLKGLFGQDHILWLGFPLFARLTDRDRVSTHVLFPFFNRVTGPRQAGWRFWPFYGHYQSFSGAGELQDDRRFYLWPFIHHHDINLDAERATRVRWYWPFYGIVDGPSFVERTFLWPIVKYRQSRVSPARRLQVFPLLTWGSGPALRQFDLWPLFGIKETPNMYRQFALFPIQRRERWETEGRAHSSSWLLPIFYRHRSEDSITGAIAERTSIWPLVSWRTEESGVSHLDALDLLPFADTGGWFDRTWSRFWRIYRQVDDPAVDRHAWEVLWGLVARERSADRTRLSVLGGLFEVGSERWRILWIPF